MITEKMTDDERFILLKDKTICVPCLNEDLLSRISDDDYIALERIGKSGAFKILRKIGEEFGVFRNDYLAEDIDAEIGFSKRNLYESVYKLKGDFQNYANMLTTFESVVGNAVGIERHSERYQNPDSNIDCIYVLLSAFLKADSIVPVLLEVKTYRDNTSSSLYIVVNFNKIKRSRIVGHTPDAKSTKPYPLPAPINVSLSKLFANVNIDDGNMLKYIPDGFLSDKQKVAKQVALAETAQYIEKKNKERYSKTGSLADGAGSVNEMVIDYEMDESVIVFILRRNRA